jgi:hypothetical protein
VLAAVAAVDHPQLIASSRHVSMDAVSVRTHDWTGNTLTLRLTCVPQTTETYWFHMPKSFATPSVAAKGASTEIVVEGEIVAIKVTAKRKACTLTISFD